MLVGLPGAGKTTIGRAAAAALGWPFVDLDEEIERRTGASVAALFERGESYFRAMERAVTESLVTAPAAIVATGGGWVTAPETVALMRPVGRITYLRVTPETAVKRLRDSCTSRPLLAGEPARAVERLHAQRRAAYEASDYVIDTESLTEQEVTALVVQLARTPEPGKFG